MNKIVFVKTPSGPMTVGDFWADRPPWVQKGLAAAAGELSTSNQIKSARAHERKNGEWSVWLEDEKGERHNFILYLSPLALKDPSVPAATGGKNPRLGVYREYGHAQGSGVEFLEAEAFIHDQFPGDVRERLLAALQRAREKLPSFDGSIEWTRTGVVLRAVNQNTQVRAFDAELRLEWER